jgi:hypothetical protein
MIGNYTRMAAEVVQNPFAFTKNGICQELAMGKLMVTITFPANFDDKKAAVCIGRTPVLPETSRDFKHFLQHEVGELKSECRPRLNKIFDCKS